MTAPVTLKKHWLQIAILAIPFAVAAACWSKFPARVPSHWGLHGQVDGWMSKGPGLPLLPAINIGIWALFAAIPRLDPKMRARQDQGRTLEVLPEMAFRVYRLPILPVASHHGRRGGYSGRDEPHGSQRNVNPVYDNRKFSRESPPKLLCGNQNPMDAGGS